MWVQSKQYTQIFNNGLKLKDYLREYCLRIDERFHAGTFNDYGAPHATPLHYIFSEGNWQKTSFFDAYNSF